MDSMQCHNEAKFYEETMPLFSALLTIDTCAQKATSFLNNEKTDTSVAADFGEGSWLSNLAISKFSAGMYLMKVVPKEDLNDVLRPDTKSSCLYRIHNDDLGELAPFMGNSQKPPRWDQSKVFDKSVVECFQEMRMIQEVMLASQLMVEVMPIFTRRSKKEQTWSQMFYQLSEKLTELDKAMEEQDTMYSRLGQATRFRCEQHGPSIKYTCSLPINVDAECVNISHGSFVALGMKDWPEDLINNGSKTQWLDKDVYWPCEDLRKRAVNLGCQFVPEPAGGQGRVGAGMSQWRLTFTKAERMLTDSWTKPQKMVYLMVRCLYYCHLNVKIGNSSFPSYALKTAMMNQLRETPRQVWTEDSVLLRVKDLLQQLENAIQEDHLPNFFLPRVNVLEDVSQEVKQAVLRKLKNISEDLTGHLSGVFIPGWEGLLQYLISTKMATRDSIKKFLQRFLPQGTEDIAVDVCREAASLLWKEKVGPKLSLKLERVLKPRLPQLDVVDNYHEHMELFERLEERKPRHPGNGMVAAVRGAADIFTDFFGYLQGGQ